MKGFSFAAVAHCHASVRPERHDGPKNDVTPSRQNVCNFEKQVSQLLAQILIFLVGSIEC